MPTTKMLIFNHNTFQIRSLSIEDLVEEMKPVAMKNHQSEYRETWKFQTTFGISLINW